MEEEKFKIMVPPDSVLGEGPLPILGFLDVSSQGERG